MNDLSYKKTKVQIVYTHGSRKNKKENIFGRKLNFVILQKK